MTFDIEFAKKLVAGDKLAVQPGGTAHGRALGEAITLIEELQTEVQRLEHALACLLDHVTGGLLSKTNYTNETMYQAADDYAQRCTDEAIEEATAELKEELQVEKDAAKAIEAIYRVEQTINDRLRAEIRQLRAPTVKSGDAPSKWAQEFSNTLHGYEKDRQFPLNGCTLHAVAQALDAARKDGIQENLFAAAERDAYRRAYEDLKQEKPVSLSHYEAGALKRVLEQIGGAIRWKIQKHDKCPHELECNGDWGHQIYGKMLAILKKPEDQ